MKKKSLLLLCLSLFALPLLAFPALAAGDPQDSPGTSDPPVFSRMSGFHIYSSQVRDFDRYEFPVSSSQKEAVEGRWFQTIYYANEGGTKPSALQIVRNYQNAATGVDGQKVYEYDDGGMQYAVLKVNREGKEFWTEVEAGGNGIYKVTMVAKQAMKQEVAITAAVMAGSLSQTGKAVLYGIYFDSGKAVIKPASRAALREIVKLIKANPGIKLYVVGHTDNVGAFDYNLKLSQARAQAVVQALVSQYGIDKGILLAHGVGPTAPVAANTSEEGRAKNRRVELVAQ